MAISLLVPLLTGCSRTSGLDNSLREITEGYRFSLFSFEVNAAAAQVREAFTSDPDVSPDRTDVVREFFNGGERDADTTKKVEEIIECQIREVCEELGILNPAANWLRPRVIFPPVNIYLGKPPHLLVVSPRDEILRYRDVLLLPDMTVEEMETIEDEVLALGYSALVVGLGGVATYPSYVNDNSGLRFVLHTAAEEWLHQYLAFTPLGFYYVLHILRIRPDYEIAKMNETVAGIVSHEIGNYIYERYYTDNEDDGNEESPGRENDFDFNAAMRETRLTVDKLLAEGKIEEAEQYMDTRREYIEEHGYYIRKLNQAYFAFYGTYAASGTSVDPIGTEFEELRSESASLKAFLDAASGLTSRSELRQALQ
jgi:hypothetical protein